jgi:hypothetical protein
MSRATTATAPCSPPSACGDADLLNRIDID